MERAHAEYAPFLARADDSNQIKTGTKKYFFEVGQTAILSGIDSMRDFLQFDTNQLLKQLLSARL